MQTAAPFMKLILLVLLTMLYQVIWATIQVRTGKDLNISFYSIMLSAIASASTIVVLMQIS